MGKYGFFVGLLFLLFSFSLVAEISSGDVIFFDLETGASSDAVIHATQSQFGSDLRMSHVGVIDIESGGEVFIIEASPIVGVRKISLADFLNQPLIRVRKIWIRSWKPELKTMARQGVLNSYKLLGRSFDPTFDLKSDQYYCSKVLYEIYRKPDNNEPYFLPHPMEFGALGSEARAFWEAYFRRLGIPIPEGQPGVSPLSIYRQGMEKYFVLP